MSVSAGSQPPKRFHTVHHISIRGSICGKCVASQNSSSCTHRLKTGIMYAPGAVASSPGAPGGAWPGASLGMSCATDACPEGGLPRPAGASAECAPGGTSSPAFAACTCSACESKVLIAERQHLTECALRTRMRPIALHPLSGHALTL